MADYIFLLETRLGTEQQTVVARLRKLCAQAGLNLYLTGGPMRDLLAGAPVRTLEFTLEGNPLRLRKELEREGVELLYADEELQSLRLRFHGVRFRLNAARREAAESAAGRPPTIMDDLRRRGLTLDAIALSLNAASRGLLLDPTNGLSDIEARQIRMAHNYVFFEDPVRLLRAVRLQTRLNFAIEERTAGRIAAAVENNYLENASKSSLGRELEAIAYEPDPGAVLKALDKADLLEAAFGKGVRTGKMNMAALARLPEAWRQWDEVDLTPDQGPVALDFILAGLPEKDEARLSRLPLSKPLVTGRQRLPAEAKALRQQMAGKPASSLAGLYDLLHRSRPEAALFLCLTTTDAKVAKRLKDFLTRIPELRQQLPLRELQLLGVHPDEPRFHDILEKVYRRLLEGTLRGAEEIQAAVRAEAAAAGALAAAGKSAGKSAKAATPAGKGVKAGGKASSLGDEKANEKAGKSAPQAGDAKAMNGKAAAPAAAGETGPGPSAPGKGAAEKKGAAKSAATPASAPAKLAPPSAAGAVKSRSTARPRPAPAASARKAK